MGVVACIATPDFLKESALLVDFNGALLSLKTETLRRKRILHDQYCATLRLFTAKYGLAREAIRNNYRMRRDFLYNASRHQPYPGPDYWEKYHALECERDSQLDLVGGHPRNNYFEAEDLISLDFELGLDFLCDELQGKLTACGSSLELVDDLDEAGNRLLSESEWDLGHDEEGEEYLLAHELSVGPWQLFFNLSGVPCEQNEDEGEDEDEVELDSRLPYEDDYSEESSAEVDEDQGPWVEP